MDGRSSLLSAPTFHLAAARPSIQRDPISVSLVLPAYNEQAGIQQAIVEACEALAELTDDYEVLVVDDGSRDDTAALAEELASLRPQVRLVRHELNRGYGAALRTGFTAARGERVAFTDADCQFHLADLGKMLALSERSPIVVGWRINRQDPWRRRFLSRGYNVLARTLLGTRVRDCDCALKMFHRDVLADLLPETNGFFVNTEMLTKARQRGLEAIEVGVRHRPRVRGTSKVSLTDVPRTLATLLPFWWSHVLFAGVSEPSPKSAAREDHFRSWGKLACLFAVAIVLFFARLGAPLLEPQEPRYAEIPRQMLNEGRWLVPVLHGQAYLDKPPLLYWLVMGSYRTFGIHDWSARLIPGLAGVLTVLCTFFWGRRVLGERAGFWGALILCLSAGFVYRQRMLNMDSLLCLWVTAALASAHAALSPGAKLHRRWWYLAALGCGLGLLTKGPVTFVLVLTPLLAYRFLEPRCPRVAIRDWSLFVLLAVAVAAPWYVAVMLREPDFAYEFFWRHHVERFLIPFDHEKPSWYYLPGLLIGMLPWTLLLPGFARYLGRRSLRAAQRRPTALGFLLLASVTCLFFFSASGCKRPGYVLPALPPLALALGCYLNQLVGLRTSRLAWRGTLLMLTLALGIVAIAGYKRMLEPAEIALLGTAPAATFVYFVVRRVSWVSCAAVTFALLAGGVTYLQPAYNRQFALRDCLQSDRFADARRVSIVCYPQRWDSVSFYLPDADVRTYGHEQRPQLLADLQAHPRTLLVVKSGKSLDELLRELPDSVEFTPNGSQGGFTAGWVRPRDASGG